MWEEKKSDVMKAISNDAVIMKHVLDNNVKIFSEYVTEKGFKFSDEEIKEVFSYLQVRYEKLNKFFSELLEDDKDFCLFFRQPREDAYKNTKEINEEYSFGEFSIFIDLHAKEVYDKLDEIKGITELSDEKLKSVSAGCGGGCGMKDDELAKILREIGKTFRGCFTEKAKVKMANKTEKSIKEIAVGDKVFGVDKFGKKVVAKVVSVMPPVEEDIYEVMFSNGVKWEFSLTQWFCSGEDVFPVLEAKGNSALCFDDSKTEIVSLKFTGRKETVYDFMLDEENNCMFINGVAAEGYGT